MKQLTPEFLSHPGERYACQVVVRRAARNRAARFLDLKRHILYGIDLPRIRRRRVQQDKIASHLKTLEDVLSRRWGLELEDPMYSRKQKGRSVLNGVPRNVLKLRRKRIAAMVEQFIAKGDPEGLNKVAVEFNVSHGTIYRSCKQYGVDISRLQAFRTKAGLKRHLQLKIVAALLHAPQGATIRDVAALLRCNPTSVQTAIHECRRLKIPIGDWR